MVPKQHQTSRRPRRPPMQPNKIPRGPPGGYQEAEINDFLSVVDGFSRSRPFGRPTAEDSLKGLRNCLKTTKKNPRGVPRRAKRAPRRPKRPPRQPREGPKTAQETFKTALQRPKEAPRQHEGGGKTASKSVRQAKSALRRPKRPPREGPEETPQSPLLDKEI